MADAAPFFDGLYTAFGRVIEGMEIVDQLLVLETEIDVDEETGEESESTRPVNPPVMRNVKVETFEIVYRGPALVETFDINEFLMELFGISI
jgi:cyclophilin family peptidyl-prolyl cis-trans isomerase